MRLFIAEKKVLGEAIAEALDGKVTIKDSVIYKGNNAVVWCACVPGREIRRKN